MQYLCNNCGAISEVDGIKYRGYEPELPNLKDGHWVSLAKQIDYWNYSVTCPVCNAVRRIMVYK